MAHPIKAFIDRWTITDSVITSEVIPAIDRVAQRNRLEVIDLHGVITDNSLMLADGIHPNAKGAGKMAEAVAKVIKQPLPVADRKSSKKTKRKK